MRREGATEWSTVNNGFGATIREIRQINETIFAKETAIYNAEKVRKKRAESRPESRSTKLMATLTRKK